MAEQMRLQRLRKREELLQAMAHGSAAAWGHLNLLGEYDFSEDKLSLMRSALGPGNLGYSDLQ